MIQADAPMLLGALGLLTDSHLLPAAPAPSTQAWSTSKCAVGLPVISRCQADLHRVEPSIVRAFLFVGEPTE